MTKWGTFFHILETVGPKVLELNPKTAPIAGLVIHAIGEAEKIKGSGTAKKAHAMATVTDAVTVAHGAGVKGFEDPTLLLQTVSDGIDTTVGAVKVIAGTKVAVSPKE